MKRLKDAVKLNWILMIVIILTNVSISLSQVNRRNNKNSSPYKANYQRVAMGKEHTLEIKSGQLWAYGLNSDGQLGDGSFVNKSTPTKIGNDDKWVTISAGDAFSIGLKSDGTLWSWGKNESGQLGLGSQIGQNSPKQVGVDNNWISVSAGSRHCLAIKADGTLWAWGNNYSYTLGDGTSSFKSTPIKIGNDNNWIYVVGGLFQSHAIKSDGTLWGWGTGWLGAEFTNVPKIPTQIGVENSWVKVVLDRTSTIGIKSNGTIWAWGNNTYGSFGIPSISSSINPIQIGEDNNWTSISKGNYTSFGIKSNGSLWYWGVSIFEPIPQSEHPNFFESPIRYGNENNWVATHSNLNSNTLIALKANGDLWAFGYGGNGQKGTGVFENNFTPVKTTGSDHGILSISVGTHTSAVLKSDGTIWTWGYNNNGQLGDGTIVGKNYPVQVGTDNNWVSIIVGTRTSHTIALKADGTLWAWGFNKYGQLGDGSKTDKYAPVQIGEDNNWVSISGGYHRTYALKADGTLWGWGASEQQTLGNGSLKDIINPTKIGSSNK